VRVQEFYSSVDQILRIELLLLHATILQTSCIAEEHFLENGPCQFLIDHYVFFGES